jgi:hypothetical protein
MNGNVGWGAEQERSGFQGKECRVWEIESKGEYGNGGDFTDRLGKERTGVVGKVPDWI